MQIVIAAFGRAVNLTIDWHSATDDNASESVSLDGPCLEVADDDEQLPFGFTLQCPER